LSLRWRIRSNHFSWPKIQFYNQYNHFSCFFFLSMNKYFHLYDLDVLYFLKSDSIYRIWFDTYESGYIYRTCAVSRWMSPLLVSGNREMRETRISCIISGKKEWELPPNILISRNPNWFQRSGTGSSSVKWRY